MDHAQRVEGWRCVIQKRADGSRHMPPCRDDEMTGKGGGSKSRKRRTLAPEGNVVRDLIRQCPGDAGSGSDGGQHGVHFGDHEARREAHDLLPAREAKAPFPGTRGMADADDLMFGQISRRAKLPAPRNVGGARIHHTMDVTHPARDQSRSTIRCGPRRRDLLRPDRGCGCSVRVLREDGDEHRESLIPAVRRATGQTMTAPWRARDLAAVRSGSPSPC